MRGLGAHAMVACSNIMTHRHFHSLTLALFVLPLTALALRAEAKSEPAPAWKLKDVDGKTVSSEEFHGKVVVLDFWATWCPPCRAEIPGYVELQKKYGGDGLAIVGVSLDQGGPAVVKQFIASQGVTYQIVMGDDKIADAFGGVEAIPTTFIIDRKGVIRYRKMGSMPAAEFEAVLRPILK